MWAWMVKAEKWAGGGGFLFSLSCHSLYPTRESGSKIKQTAFLYRQISPHSLIQGTHEPQTTGYTVKAANAALRLYYWILMPVSFCGRLVKTKFPFCRLAKSGLGHEKSGALSNHSSVAGCLRPTTRKFGSFSTNMYMARTGNAAVSCYSLIREESQSLVDAFSSYFVHRTHNTDRLKARYVVHNAHIMSFSL